MYPVISDRVQRTKDYDCKFEPDENPVFVVAMAFVGHHVPCLVIVLCYAVVYVEIRNLVKTRPQNGVIGGYCGNSRKTAAPVGRSVSLQQLSITKSCAHTPDVRFSDDKKCAPSTGQYGQTSGGGALKPGSSTETKEETMEAGSGFAKEKNIRVVDARKKMDNYNGRCSIAQGDGEMQNYASTSQKKAFITLSYIVAVYVICWVPFHFVFDVSLARPEVVPEDAYTATFWLAYINSGLNPFMYAFSSADFR
jgi:7 transmembrane receptor (rhodopsin family)